MNLFLAVVGIGLFVAPTFYRLVDHARTRPTRHLSVLAHPWRHVAFALFRLGLVVGAYTLTATFGSAAMLSYLGVLVLGSVLVAVAITDRRLFVNAATGLVTFEKISVPWFRPGMRVNYIDHMRPQSYGGENTLNLWGLAELKRFYTLNYNGSNTCVGNYGTRTLVRLNTAVNQYIKAFQKHDAEGARDKRRQFRAENEAKLAPARLKVAAQTKRARENAEADARKLKLATDNKRARAAAKQKNSMESKFGSSSSSKFE